MLASQVPTLADCHSLQNVTIQLKCTNILFSHMYMPFKESNLFLFLLVVHCQIQEPFENHQFIEINIQLQIHEILYNRYIL